jgi:hypothetical protein
MMIMEDLALLFKIRWKEGLMLVLRLLLISVGWNLKGSRRKEKKLSRIS